MSNIINLFKRTFERYIDSFRRFYIGQGLIVGLGLLLCVDIIYEINSELVFSVSFALGIAILISFLISFCCDNKILYIFIPLILAIVLSFVYFYCYSNYYVIMASIGLYIAIIFLLYYRMLKNTKGNLFIYLLSKSIYVSVICFILSTGLLICTTGFQFLIYDFDFLDKIISIIFIITNVMIGGTLFVSYLPYKNEELKNNNVFIILLSKIPLTLYYLLLVILYIYLFKIVFTWTLPVGVINWFASFALYFYIYFIYASDDDYFLSKFHQKYGSYVLIPIFIIQQISILIRVNAYGLTELRVLSFVFNLIGLVLIILNIFKKRELFFIISACIIFIFTVFPYINIIDLPVLEQEARLKRILIDNDMYKDGEIIANQSVSNESKDEIVSCYNFLINSPSDKLNLITDNINFKNTFGFDKSNYGSADEIGDEDDYNSFNKIETCSYFGDYETIDIENYKSIEMLDYVDMENDGNIENFCEDIYQKYGNYTRDLELIYKISDEEIIYIENLYFERDNKGTISNIGIKGFKLHK